MADADARGHGLLCAVCGEGRIRRPISDHYDEETGRVWHTPEHGWQLYAGRRTGRNTTFSLAIGDGGEG